MSLKNQISRTIVNLSDSLGTTSGGTLPSSQMVAQNLDPAIFKDHGIPGQTQQQIFARGGGEQIPVTLTGNAWNGLNAVTLSNIGIQFLSTPADNNTREVSGTVNGIQCIITRTATGTAPSQVETYTIQPLLTQSTNAIAANSVFIPDLWNNIRDSIIIIQAGRNNIPSDVSGIVAAHQKFVSRLPNPQRFIITGILASTAETIGTANRTIIDSVNAALKSAFPNNYIELNPNPNNQILQAAMRARMYYTADSTALTQIANGVIPTDLRAVSDTLHWNPQGKLVAIYQYLDMILQKGWF